MPGWVRLICFSGSGNSARPPTRKSLDLFEALLPQLVFALQNLELFLCLEKKLLAARGVLDEASTYVRRPTWTPDQEHWPTVCA